MHKMADLDELFATAFRLKHERRCASTPKYVSLNAQFSFRTWDRTTASWKVRATGGAPAAGKPASYLRPSRHGAATPSAAKMGSRVIQDWRDRARRPLSWPRARRRGRGGARDAHLLLDRIRRARRVTRAFREGARALPACLRCGWLAACDGQRFGVEDADRRPRPRQGSSRAMSAQERPRIAMLLRAKRARRKRGGRGSRLRVLPRQ